MIRIAAILILISALAPAQAGDRFSFDDLAFLEGAWKGGEDFTFEEIWSGPEGGVMTAMARGVKSGTLAVLEYIVVSDEDAGLVMRFKHYNADFSTWEEAGPVTLVLTDASENDVTFTADPPSETVKSIRYWMPDENSLQADIVLIENGEEGGFSLLFERSNR